MWIRTQKSGLVNSDSLSSISRTKDGWVLIGRDGRQAGTVGSHSDLEAVLIPAVVPARTGDRVFVITAYDEAPWAESQAHDVVAWRVWPDGGADPVLATGALASNQTVLVGMPDGSCEAPGVASYATLAEAVADFANDAREAAAKKAQP